MKSMEGKFLFLFFNCTYIATVNKQQYDAFLPVAVVLGVKSLNTRGNKDWKTSPTLSSLD